MAEDVVQETWIRANAASAVLPDNPKAYLYRMAGNLAIDHLRRRVAWERMAKSAEESVGAPNTLLEELPNAVSDPLDVVISHRELDVLCAAVSELPDKCREVFLLYRGHGLTMREIALHLSISDKTVEKHIARAMVHCRARLKDAGRAV